jgi:hypothetical protein
VDLAVLVNGDHPHDGYPCTVPGKQHRARADPIRIPGVGQHRPSKAVVVLGVQVCKEFDRASISAFIARVAPGLMVTAQQPCQPLVEGVPGEGEVPRIATADRLLKTSGERDVPAEWAKVAEDTASPDNRRKRTRSNGSVQ